MTFYFYWCFTKWNKLWYIIYSMSFQCCCSNINNQCRKIDINTTLIKLTLDTSHSTLQYLSNILSMFRSEWTWISCINKSTRSDIVEIETCMKYWWYVSLRELSDVPNIRNIAIVYYIIHNICITIRVD